MRSVKCFFKPHAALSRLGSLDCASTCVEICSQGSRRGFLSKSFSGLSPTSVDPNAFGVGRDPAWGRGRGEVQRVERPAAGECQRGDKQPANGQQGGPRPEPFSRRAPDDAAYAMAPCDSMSTAALRRPRAQGAIARWAASHSSEAASVQAAPAIAATSKQDGLCWISAIQR